MCGRHTLASDIPSTCFRLSHDRPTRRRVQRARAAAPDVVTHRRVARAARAVGAAERLRRRCGCGAGAAARVSSLNPRAPQAQPQRSSGRGSAAPSGVARQLASVLSIRASRFPWETLARWKNVCIPSQHAETRPTRRGATPRGGAGPRTGVSPGVRRRRPGGRRPGRRAGPRVAGSARLSRVTRRPGSRSAGAWSPSAPATPAPPSARA